MKLLQALKSILPGGSILENQQWNWFTASHTIRQRKLFCYKPPNSVAKTVSLQATQFGDDNCFATGHLIWQQTHFQQRMLIHCSKHTFDNECLFAADNSILVAKSNSLKTTQFHCTNTISLQTTELRQWTLIRYRQRTFGSEHKFAANNTILSANADSLQITHFLQRTRVRCRQHNFGSEH